jgi:hypothetical protein
MPWDQHYSCGGGYKLCLGISITPVVEATSYALCKVELIWSPGFALHHCSYLYMGTRGAMH